MRPRQCARFGVDRNYDLARVLDDAQATPYALFRSRRAEQSPLQWLKPFPRDQEVRLANEVSENAGRGSQTRRASSRVRSLDGDRTRQSQECRRSRPLPSGARSPLGGCKPALARRLAARRGEHAEREPRRECLDLATRPIEAKLTIANGFLDRNVAKPDLCQHT